MVLEGLCSNECLGRRYTVDDAVPWRSPGNSLGCQELTGSLMDSEGTEVVTPHCSPFSLISPDCRRISSRESQRNLDGPGVVSSQIMSSVKIRSCRLLDHQSGSGYSRIPPQWAKPLLVQPQLVQHSDYTQWIIDISYDAMFHTSCPFLVTCP